MSNPHMHTIASSSPMNLLLCHDLELVYLKRRIQFLTRLQKLIDEDAWTEDFEELAAQFPDVADHSQLKARLKEIYEGRRVLN